MQSAICYPGWFARPQRSACAYQNKSASMASIRWTNLGPHERIAIEEPFSIGKAHDARDGHSP
ncbi:hypothetical protein HC891_01585 [Candidatus Gracilibacteria bacterium]|nr:hypothetical protein [Candidatus Gracilibacteria bacterium]